MRASGYMSLIGALLGLGAGSSWAAPVEGVIESVDPEGLRIILRVAGTGKTPIPAMARG